MASFNFYQYEGTGSYTFFTGSDISLIGDPTQYWYGPFLPTSSPHWESYTGFYTPHSLIIGGGAGFQLSITDDIAFPARIKTRFSGQVGNRVNEVGFINIGMSGEIAPKVADDASTNINLTGSYNSGLNDYPLFKTNYSGQQSGLRDDYGYVYVDFSGQQTGLKDDESYIEVSVSGETKAQQYEPCYFGTFWSGSIFKKDADYTSITLTLNALSFSTGGKYIIIGSGDTASITLSFVDATYEPPRV